MSQVVPDASGDDPVAEPHPDAFPDILLDLVVILRRVSSGLSCPSHRIGWGEDGVKLEEVGGVGLLGGLQLVVLQLVVGRLHQGVHLRQALQAREEGDWGAAAAPGGGQSVYRVVFRVWYLSWGMLELVWKGADPLHSEHLGTQKVIKGLRKYQKFKTVNLIMHFHFV